MRAVGDYQASVIASAASASANCSAAPEPVIAQLQEHGAKFDAELEKLLKRLWDDVVREGQAAKKSLHNITHAIVSELRQDASEQGAYERIMRDAGEDPGALGYRHHEVERLDGKEAWDDEDEDHHVHGRRHHHHHGGEDPDGPYGHGRDADYGDDAAEHNGHHMHDDDDEYRDDDDEEHLAGALEALLEKLHHNDSVLLVDNATLESWTQLHASSTAALQDDEQEVDMERVNKRIASALHASHANVPAYNETEWDTELDYLTAMLHKARLAPYRAELLELLEAWQKGETRISVPIKRIEELIDDDVLPPDALLVHGDYEHYRYDDD